MSKGTTYKDSGVDIDAGNESIKRVRKNIHSTFNSSVLTGIGTFGAMYDLSDIIKTYKKPVLVQSIDSVGTKLVVANMANFHKTIGIDMVAHSCNDVLCQGARPITFLDYIAVDKLDPNHIQDVVDGICEGCREADLPLTGGELAELPGVYKEGEYDLVGAVSGVVEKDKIIDGLKIAPGDAVLGLASSGLHTNGFSLARNVLFNIKKFNVDQYMEELECTLGEALLKPHINYTRPVLSLLDEFNIKGIAHITGGGLVNNLPRVLPENCQVMVSKVPFYSFKDAQSMNRIPFANAIMIPLIFILILLEPPLVMTVMASTYVASGPINSLIRFVKKLHIRSQNSSHSE